MIGMVQIYLMYENLSFKVFLSAVWSISSQKKKKKSDPSYVNTLTEVYNGHTLELSYYNQNF